MLGNHICTRDNAWLPAIFSGLIAAAFLITTLGDIGQVVVYSTIISGLVWLVGMNLVQLDPNHFLVVEDLTQKRVAEDWTQKKPEDWVQEGPYRVIEYNRLTCGYAWLPIQYERKRTFFAGRIPLEPLIIRGVITADNQIVEIELGLSYRLDSSAEACWTQDRLDKRFDWKECARETAEKTVRTFMMSLPLQHVLKNYREELLQSELEDALSMALTTIPIVMEIENVLIPTVVPLKEPTYSVIMSSLTEDQQRQVQGVWTAVGADKIKHGEIMRALGEIEETLRAIGDGHLVVSLNPALEKEIRDMAVALTRGDLTVTQKFKLAIPIIPLALNSETEIAKSWKIDLGSLWKVLTNK